MAEWSGLIRTVADDPQSAETGYLDREATAAALFVESVLLPLLDGWNEVLPIGERARRLHAALIASRSSADPWVRSTRRTVQEILGSLEPDQTPTSVAEAEEMFAALLDAPMLRLGRYGDEVLLCEVADAALMDLDLLVVVGAAEGNVPLVPRGSGLLLADDINALSGATDGVPDAVRRADAAFSALPSSAQRVVITFPRSDTSTSVHREPSRFVARLVAERIGADWGSRQRGWVRGGRAVEAVEQGKGCVLVRVSEHLDVMAGSIGPEPHASVPDYDEAVAVSGRADGYDDDAWTAQRACVTTRSEGRYDRFTGCLPHVAAEARDRGLTIVPVSTSPSDLETLGGCPSAFLIKRVLGVREQSQLDPSTLDAASSGSIVHLALETLIPVGPPRPRPSSGMVAGVVRAAMESIAPSVLGGPDGRHELQRVARLVEGLLDVDERSRSSDWVTVEVEVERDEEIPLEAGHGSPVWRVRYRPDRVVSTSDGILVIDYKSGKGKTWDDREAALHVSLPLYAVLAARRAAAQGGDGSGEATIRAAYWYPSAPPAGGTVDPHLLTHRIATLLAVADRGHFPSIHADFATPAGTRKVNHPRRYCISCSGPVTAAQAPMERRDRADAELLRILPSLGDAPLDAYLAMRLRPGAAS